MLSSGVQLVLVRGTNAPLVVDRMQLNKLSSLQSSRTDCNHVFLNFTSTLTITDPMNPSQLMSTVREMVVRYGPRLWKSRILQAELKMTVRYECYATYYIHLSLPCPGWAVDTT